jgi:hypothetical protein
MKKKGEVLTPKAIRIIHHFELYGTLSSEELGEWYERTHPTVPQIEGVVMSWIRKTLPNLPKTSELEMSKFLDSLVKLGYLKFDGLTSFTDRAHRGPPKRMYCLSSLGQEYKQRTEHR